MDRTGGQRLYNMSEDFYNLLKEIECICRRHLDVRAVPSENLSDAIRNDALACPVMAGLWQNLATSIQSDSMPVLKAIIKLWINIRVHSFTHKWSDVLIQLKKEATAHEKALRKSLKQKNTDKDHNK